MGGRSSSFSNTVDAEKILEAAKRNDFATVKFFLDGKAAPPSITDEFNGSIAHIAAKVGNLDMLKYVMDKSPWLVNTEGRAGWEPLFLAIERGSLDMVKYLVETYKPDLYKEFYDNCGMNGTPAQYAAAYGHLDILKYFIEEKNITATDPKKESYRSKGEPFLFLAVKYHHPDIIKYLIERKDTNLEEVGADNENILFSIVRKDDLNLLKYLLDEKKLKVNINHENGHGNTLVQLAAQLNRNEIIKYLIEVKRAKTNENFLLHYAAKEGNLDLCEYAVRHGAKINGEDGQHETPIFLALKGERRVDADNHRRAQHTDNKSRGERPYLYGPASKNHFEVFKYLLEKGASTNVSEKLGGTLLHVAAERNRTNIIEYLVSGNHIDINIRRPGDNMTALHCAASKNNYNVCRYLIEHGADTHAEDVNGETPSQKTEDEKLIEYLDSTMMSRHRRSITSSSFLQRLIPIEPRREIIDYGLLKKLHHSNERAQIDFSNNFVYQHGLQCYNIFILFQLLVGNLKGLVRRSSFNKPTFWAPESILLDKVDLIAEDAIGTLPKFVES